MSSLTRERRQWMAVLAQSSADVLERQCKPLKLKPDYQLLRPTQIGLVQLQGRMEVTGARFMLGDMTVSRAAVQLKDGTCGYSYVIGRNRVHAERCAWLDALLQTEEVSARLWDKVVIPLHEQLQAQRAHQHDDVAASRVNFFTLVRGE